MGKNSASLTRRPGPSPKPFESGNKKQARQRINVEVRTSRRAHPSTLPCTDCGHLGDDRRHEYDHYLGYKVEHFLDVEPVCTVCHTKRDNFQANKTHCIHGHEFIPENTKYRKNGTRECRACHSQRKKKIRTAEWWRNYRVRRKNRG